MLRPFGGQLSVDLPQLSQAFGSHARLGARLWLILPFLFRAFSCIWWLTPKNNRNPTGCVASG